jgi:hypothetical protein
MVGMLNGSLHGKFPLYAGLESRRFPRNIAD